MIERLKDYLKRKNVNVQDVASRTAKTFVAAFLAVVPVSGVVGGDIDVLQAGAVAGATAVVTLVWNVLLDWSRDE